MWMLYIDTAPEHGGRLSLRFRSLSFWAYFAEYYPASCVIALVPFPSRLTAWRSPHRIQTSFVKVRPFALFSPGPPIDPFSGPRRQTCPPTGRMSSATIRTVRALRPATRPT
jgi:hypothetical protein